MGRGALATGKRPRAVELCAKTMDLEEPPSYPRGAGGGGESPGRLGKPTGGTLAESSRSGEQMDPWKGAQAAVGTP